MIRERLMERILADLAALTDADLAFAAQWISYFRDLREALSHVR